MLASASAYVCLREAGLFAVGWENSAGCQLRGSPRANEPGPVSVRHTETCGSG